MAGGDICCARGQLALPPATTGGARPCHPHGACAGGAAPATSLDIPALSPPPCWPCQSLHCHGGVGTLLEPETPRGHPGEGVHPCRGPGEAGDRWGVWRVTLAVAGQAMESCAIESHAMRRELCHEEAAVP